MSALSIEQVRPWHPEALDAAGERAADEARTGHQLADALETSRTAPGGTSGDADRSSSASSADR